MTVSNEMRARLEGLVDLCIDQLIAQRDRARRCAVALEQENHALEIERDALIAECEGLRIEARELRAALSGAEALTRPGGNG